MVWQIQKPLLRLKQSVFKAALPFMQPPCPKLLSGTGMVKQLPEVVKKEGITNVLVVTDKVLMDLGLPKGLLDVLGESDVRYTVFDDVQPNPTIQNIEEGLKIYLDNDCEGIIGFGGGSPIDCAKAIGARKAHPNKTVKQMRGLFKIRKNIPPLFAVPTTAGTGSEATVAAVVTDPENHEKFPMGDRRLVPLWAVLDPELTVSLPRQITAATGMDALTHAVEAYISGFANDVTDDFAEKAAGLIFANLEKVYEDGSDLESRNNMMLASYYAGMAFTRAMLGYVHAIAHRMGGLYGLPHGMANAIILPHVLSYSRKDAEKKLSRLAIVAGVGSPNDSDEALSRGFIDRIREMNQKMGIPAKIKEIQERDIPLIVKRAMAEVHFAYAPPTMMSPDQCEAVIRELML